LIAADSRATALDSNASSGPAGGLALSRPMGVGKTGNNREALPGGCPLAGVLISCESCANWPAARVVVRPAARCRPVFRACRRTRWQGSRASPWHKVLRPGVCRDSRGKASRVRAQGRGRVLGEDYLATAEVRIPLRFSSGSIRTDFAGPENRSRAHVAPRIRDHRRLPVPSP